MGTLRGVISRTLPHMAKDDGTQIYSKWFLRIYDAFVLDFSNRYAWKCSTSKVLLPLYRSAMGARHLEIGVGTGYYPQRALELGQRCRSITLADLNPNTIELATRRILDAEASMRSKDNKTISTNGEEGKLGTENITIRPIVADAFEPLPLPPNEKFDSIALFYLLHCVPLPPQDKARIFDLLRPRLAPDGVLIGATLLGKGVKRNALAESLTQFYNWRGIINNLEDSWEVFEEGLRRNFEEVDLDLVGLAMVWKARRPRPA